MKDAVLKFAPDHRFIYDMLRFVEEYGWSFALSSKTLNCRYGTDYTTAELRHYYTVLRGIGCKENAAD